MNRSSAKSNADSIDGTVVGSSDGWANVMPVTEVDSLALEQLTVALAETSKAQPVWSVNDWPQTQLSLIADAGVYRWFVSQQDGGCDWSAADVAKGYVALGRACLTSTFIVTQRVAALKRIANSKNEALKARLLPEMLDGSSSATVGISHLTTSRRHTAKPVMQVTQHGDHWRVNGRAPWVTGASHARWVLMGGVLDDAREILFVVSTDAQGVKVEPGFDMIALSATHTGMVMCDQVVVPASQIVAGPIENVLVSRGGGSGAGGVQTSALGLGLVGAAIGFLEAESVARPALSQICQSLQQQFDRLMGHTLKVASGVQSDTVELRSAVNSLARRSTQAALIAAKGAGFLHGHPVGRWCQEALFFLVWSCPQTVSDAGLCELLAQSEVTPSPAAEDGTVFPNSQ